MMYVFVNLAVEFYQFPKTDKYGRKKRDKMEKIASWMFPLFSSSSFSENLATGVVRVSCFLYNMWCDVTCTKTKGKEEKY